MMMMIISVIRSNSDSIYSVTFVQHSIDCMSKERLLPKGESFERKVMNTVSLITL